MRRGFVFVSSRARPPAAIQVNVISFFANIL